MSQPIGYNLMHRIADSTFDLLLSAVHLLRNFHFGCFELLASTFAARLSDLSSRISVIHDSQEKRDICKPHQRKFQ